MTDPRTLLERGSQEVAVGAGTRASYSARVSVRTKAAPLLVQGVDPPTIAVYVLRLQATADGVRTAMSFELDPTSWYTDMRPDGVWTTWRTWLTVPFDPPAEMVFTRSMAKAVDPVGVPKVRTDPFCTVRVAPLGADEAPSTAKPSAPTPRTASSTSGIRLRRGTRQS